MANSSSYVFAGTSDSLNGLSFTSLDGYVQTSGGTIAWGQNCTGINFGSSGNKSYSLAHGYDYSSATGGMSLSLSDVLASYEIFRNPAEYDINFLIAGPDGGSTIFESQAFCIKRKFMMLTDLRTSSGCNLGPNISPTT